MLRVSVSRAMHCETVALTDRETVLPGETFRYAATEHRLMLWILDVCHAYLYSEDFDRDTILLSPDLLVYGNLRPWMRDEFVVVMRQKFIHHPILNGVQCWPVALKDGLQRFYTRALEIGRGLPENFIRWGGDTEPMRQLLMPLRVGRVERCGLPVRLVESVEIMAGFTNVMERMITRGVAIPPSAAIMDFRYLRKRAMRAYFEATIGSGVSA